MKEAATSRRVAGWHARRRPSFEGPHLHYRREHGDVVMAKNCGRISRSAQHHLLAGSSPTLSVADPSTRYHCGSVGPFIRPFTINAAPTLFVNVRATCWDSRWATSAPASGLHRGLSLQASQRGP